MRFLGERVHGGRFYLNGGASAVIVGWRTMTVDVDLKLEPEPIGVFEAITEAKEALDINVDPAAPDDFIPALPDWRERSLFLARHGTVKFFHYDFYAQALAKIARDHESDRSDVRAMHRLKFIEPQPLMQRFEAIESDIQRYPSLSLAHFHDRVRAMVARLTAANGYQNISGPCPKWNVQDIPFNLPGADFVTAGIAALHRGELTKEALLVAVATSRLREIGLDIPEAADTIKEPNLALYAAVCEAGGGHYDYNALIQRLVSFAQAAEWVLRERE